MNVVTYGCAVREPRATGFALPPRAVLLAAVSLATLLTAGRTAIAVVALVLVVAGVANAVPLLFSAAGRVPPAGPSLAAVFTIGYLGFILGPSVIGVLADTITLTAALGLVCAALVLVALLGGRALDGTREMPDACLRPPPAPPRGRPTASRGPRGRPRGA